MLKPTTLLEELMFVVKRIEARGGGKAWVGTGYAYDIPRGSDQITPLIITNRHVAEGAESIRILFHTTMNGQLDGGHTYIDVTHSNGVAILHPDPSIDLAAIVVGGAINEWSKSSPDSGLHWLGFSQTNFWPEDKFKDLDACEPVMMVGCPSGLWDEENGFPIFRKGVTATHPEVDFQGRPEFVIDIGVYSGSSGSPVFLYEQGLVKADKTVNTFSPGGRFGLLGTLWGGPRITEKGDIVVEPAPTDARVGVETAIRMHLGYVIKARELLALEKEVNVRLGLTS
jgi:Trypsin-like peptidase domain